MNILIVDDDPNARKILGKILKAKGFEVEEAGSGAEAAATCRAKFFNLVLIDLRLPDISGLEVLKTVHRANEDTMAIMMTGYASLDSSIEAMNQGAFSYITKPVNIDQALVIIGQALEKQRLSLENKRLLKELQEANEKLKALDQLKSDFISTVSHELRTPLAIIKQGVDLVLGGTAGEINPAQNKYLSIAKRNIDRLARLINDVLDIAKIEAHKVELKLENFDLGEKINLIAAEWKVKAEEKKLNLEIASLPQAPLLVCADVDKIEEILDNLISNSLKFTPEGGNILIEAAAGDKFAEVSVTDTGRGIAPENLPKLFSKFQQFGRTAGPGEKGTGLGLAIARGLVELMGGVIQAESKPGQGTRFTFTLPLDKAA